jgi:hypothetical protein
MATTERARATKARENRLRRLAEAQGLILHKSGRRDPRALSYDTWWLVDPETDKVVLHERTLATGEIVGVALDEVEQYLASDR